MKQNHGEGIRKVSKDKKTPDKEVFVEKMGGH